MERLRPAFVFPLIIFAFLATIFGIYLYQVGITGKVISDIPSALIDKPVPTFDLPPITGNGTGFSSKKLTGEVSLVNVWASWCPPCRVEHPLLMRMANEGVKIHGINYKDTPFAALAFLDQLGNPFKMLGADRTGRTAIDWGVYGYPETFVVDKSGHIRYRHVGPITVDDINDKIYPMLKALKQ
jgi:cytochrome c biogenesis protein CcmG/thiol:disulfide interchange protein DsbE